MIYKYNKYKYKSKNAPWYEAGVTSWEGQAQSWEAWSSPEHIALLYLCYFDDHLIFSFSHIDLLHLYYVDDHLIFSQHFAIFLSYLVMIMKLGN